MFYAITIQSGELVSFRSLASATDPLDMGEQLWSGAMPTNPVWDTTLNNGTGGIRQMSSAELQEQASAAASTSQQHTIDTLSLNTFYNKVQDGDPLTIEDVAEAFCAFLRVCALSPSPAETTVSPSPLPAAVS